MRYIQLKQNTGRIRLSLLCILICMVFSGCGKNSTVYFENEEKSDEKETEERETGEDVVTGQPETEEVTENRTVFVFVCGSVKNPGVYELSEGARVCEAIELAGGMTGEASNDYWNLAEIVLDGQKIYVPTALEVEQGNCGGQVFSDGDAGTQDTKENVDDGRININTADEEQLMKLSGIGESRAKAIVTYRTEHGTFSSVEEIMNVTGIGNAIFSQLKDLITI